MAVLKKFIVYRLNNIMESKKYLALEEVKFQGWKSNNFDTEDEAIQAIIEDGMKFEEFIILKQIYINK